MLILTIFGVLLCLAVFCFLAFQSFEKRMQQTFHALSYEAMEKNNKAFLDIAKLLFEKYQEGIKGEFEKKQEKLETLLTPLNSSLEKINQETKEIEKARERAYASLTEQIQSLLLSEKNLQKETLELSSSLQSPNIRGAWGQMHLKRVLELSGMVNYCDFYEQPTQRIEGQILRPDLLIHLPGDRHLVIDAKTPMQAYLEASAIHEEEAKRKKLEEHVLQIKKHMKDLSSKEYWKQLAVTPEYVILFLPAEAFFSAALQVDPTLLETAAELKIVLATPTTLIAILRAVAYSWKQENISKSAIEIAKIGKELYERLLTMNQHWSVLGKNLSQSIDAYNQALSSFESRVLVSARKLKDFGFSSSNLTVEEIVKTTRSIEQEKLVE